MRGHREALRTAVITVGRALCAALVAGAVLGAVRAAGVRHSPSWVWLAAAVLVAGSVLATRKPVEFVADRLTYGTGGDPYAVLSGFVQRIAETLAVDDVLPHVARTVTQAVHGDRGEVRLWLADGQRWRESWPPNVEDQVDDDVDIALLHHGQQVGDLGLAKATGALSAEDREMLNRLAGTAGLALANVRLTHDLRRRLAESTELAGRLEQSRQRLLDASAEQTRRFSTLVDAQVQSRLDATRAALDQVGAGDRTAVDAAKTEATAALAALRELAAGVFPPALADRGLGNALEAYSLRFEDRVAVTYPSSPVRAPLAVEAAAYFCAVQVVENAGSARRARLELQQDEEMLRLRADTADALDPDTVQLLRDRSEATGGCIEFGQDPATSITIVWSVRRRRPDPGSGPATERSGP
ncbi:MAG: hypothetical protein JWN06_1739 [Propionibacteriaceae bacterium]|jgi:hypothetical protein|nr:hypothetical protein [Propionibacteriaceae bacterium]